MLEAIEVLTAPNPQGAIIWLHGLGADGHDFEPVVPELVPRAERAWRFVFPHAPVRPVTINNGMRMRAWYDITGFDRGAKEDVAGFEQAGAMVTELIEREVSRGIAPGRIVIAGFSQGGAVTLYAVPRFKQKLAGAIALSCYLPREATFAAERNPANDTTPIFMAHGAADPVVPLPLGQHARDFLKIQGYKVEWHDYPMPHAVCPPEIAAIREYLMRVLP
ncbi:MAG TPA: alpha/beta fold hydrolase [Steroidobacteraceae bacterium]|jgi:phospholipase/carboxylesterase